MTPLLLLVPTELERRVLAPLLAAPLAATSGTTGPIELCGFGPVAAAARTAGLLALHRPARVVLVGIAGRLDDRLPIGSAHLFDQVACFGIGAGSGPQFVPATRMGWPHWPGAPADPAVVIGDVISCASPTPRDVPRAGLLLTACAAAGCADDVAERQALYPAACAEDMEGFAVALACRLAGVPLDIVRGISNTAGDRDTHHWQIAPALAAAAELARRILETPR
jgi:futalosine hydrolase